jgi:hypothetical protein
VRDPRVLLPGEALERSLAVLEGLPKPSLENRVWHSARDR